MYVPEIGEVTSNFVSLRPEFPQWGKRRKKLVMIIIIITIIINNTNNNNNNNNNNRRTRRLRIMEDERGKWNL